MRHQDTPTSLMEPPPPAAATSTHDSRAAGPVRRLSDPRLPHHLLETLSINPPETYTSSSLGLQPESVIVRKGMSLAFGRDEYGPLLAAHDRRFQQVMHQRHEQFRALEEMATDISHRVEASRTKAQEIAEMMVEVHAVVEGERRRWKEKLIETKMEVIS